MTNFTWGTVTAVSPLRVQLDGDTAALPFAPDSLVDPLGLGVGDRVRCELSARHVILIGRSQGDGLAGFIGEHKAGEWVTSPHPSWVLADGSILNIADWPRLADHYAAVYGAVNHHGGNGTTTFAVPDTRERTYVNQGGADSFAVIGSKTGTKRETLTTAEMPVHTHGVPGGTAFVANGSGGAAAGVTTGGGGYQLRAPANAGSGQSHNNVQPSFVCRYVIRAA